MDRLEEFLLHKIQFSCNYLCFEGYFAFICTLPVHAEDIYTVYLQSPWDVSSWEVMDSLNGIKNTTLFFEILFSLNIVMILSFRTGRSGQTVQTQIRLLLGAVWSASTLFEIPSIFWSHYSTLKPPCSNVRVITANFSSVWNFRIFIVYQNNYWFLKQQH